MKKAVLAIAIALGAFTGKADVITNYVYVVSNIFNNVYTENVITQKVKNTHYNYYFTNNVSVVTNVYQTTFQTNIEVNVIFDNFDPWVNAASNAAVNASSFASAAASNATDAASAAVYASSAVSMAAAYAQAASAYASDGLNRINQRIQWFDEHSGETITQINITTNLYFAEDSVARSGVAQNAADIASLESRVGDNIQQLTTRMGTAENDIRNLKTYSDILRKQLGYIPDRFVYTVKKDGVYIGDLIVNVSKRSVVASNDTTRTFNFEYSTTWSTASNPRITSLSKTVPYVGKSATPSCNLVISFMSGEYQVNLTGPSVDSNELSFIYSGWSLRATDHECTFEFAGVEGIEIANIMGSFFGSSKYKSPGGVVYDRIDVYTTPTNGNKVAAYATGQASADGTTVVGASLGYTVHFSSSWVTNPNIAANCWEVMPAFTEFVDGVLKLHFVPTARKAISAKTGTADAGCVYLLEDFYWSDGCIYCVVASYRDGVFRGRIKCKFVDGTYLSYPYVKVSFPDSICSQLSAGTYSANMEFDSREGEIMGTGSTAGLVRFKTIKGSVAAKDSPVVFPENPSMINMINMVWYNTYGQ